MKQGPFDLLRWLAVLTCVVVGAGVAALAETDLQALPVGLTAMLLILVADLPWAFPLSDVAGLLLGVLAYVFLEYDRGGDGVRALVAAIDAFILLVVARHVQAWWVRRGETGVTDLRQVTEDLSLFDVASGLLKRNYGEAALAEEVLRARRTGTDLSLVLVTLDSPDGQLLAARAMSEEIVAVIGEVVLGALRATDRSARLGPTLFAAILPATNAAGGSTVAQKLRHAVAHATGQQVHCAVAAFPHHAASASELIEEAEAALGLARAAGLPMVSPSMLREFATT